MASGPRGAHIQHALKHALVVKNHAPEPALILRHDIMAKVALVKPHRQ